MKATKKPKLRTIMEKEQAKELVALKNQLKNLRAAICPSIKEPSRQDAAQALNKLPRLHKLLAEAAIREEELRRQAKAQNDYSSKCNIELSKLRQQVLRHDLIAEQAIELHKLKQEKKTRHHQGYVLP